MRRLLLLTLVALGLAPTWLRSPLPPEDDRQVLTVTPLTIRATDLGGLRLAGAWRLDSPNRHFGAYSALVALGDGTLLVASDRGRMLRFSPPGSTPRRPRFDYYAGQDTEVTGVVDLEALTRDPATGHLWAAYEGVDQIERHDARFRSAARVRPAAMRNWPRNQGAEAIVRLADGRFIVLAEGSPRWFASRMPALLFPGDPVEGAEPLPFRFAPPEGFRPVDMAQIPNGRVLILLREVEWRLPPRFVSRLVVADPNEIAPGITWRGRTLAEIVEPLPAENYEGLAVERASDGSLVLWLISDDNRAKFQRTLLLKLVWPANEQGARIAPRASSIRPVSGLRRPRRPS